MDRIITWGQMARALGVILVLAGVGAAVSRLPNAVQLLFTIVGVVVCAFAAAFAWCTLRDGQRAREYLRRQPEPPRMEGAHGAWEERTDFDLQQEARRQSARALARARKAPWN